MYEERIIAFVDILGFENMLNNHSDIEIKNILAIPHEYFNKKQNKEYENIEITIISDSIIISFLYTEEHAVYKLLLDLLNIIIKFINNGIICRGAIVKGHAIHSENIIFGQGYINAYRMEQNIFYPKIEFSEEIYNIGCKYHQIKKTEKHERVFINTLYNKDDYDDSFYIDYFASPISSIRDVILGVSIKEYLTNLLNIINIGLSNKNKKITKKYVWMKNKYEMVLNSLVNIFDTTSFNVLFRGLCINDIYELKGKLKNKNGT